MKQGNNDILFSAIPADEVRIEVLFTEGHGSLGDAVLDIKQQYVAFLATLVPAENYLIRRTQMTATYDDNATGNRYSAALLIEYIIR